jgi:hypothetical protein
MKTGAENNVSQSFVLAAIDGTVIGPVLTLSDPVFRWLFRVAYLPYRYWGWEPVNVDIETGLTFVKER